ncbi:hypothetical protein AB1Y20_006082 [Prymnesium parvum]|uniref:Uncharacterized protein n=1 Tax=Prymnesium parvum TaxID=97485 RepID=A0AB34J454_PRYPA
MCSTAAHSSPADCCASFRLANPPTRQRSTALRSIVHSIAFIIVSSLLHLAALDCLFLGTAVHRAAGNGAASDPAATLECHRAPYALSSSTGAKALGSQSPAMPAVGAPRGQVGTVLHIIVTELCERFAFYGLAGSLTYYFMTLGLRPDLAAFLNQLFLAVVYVTPVFGAYVADVYLGRYQTILVFCGVYITGLLLTTLSAWPTETVRPHTNRSLLDFSANDSTAGDAPFYVSSTVSHSLALIGVFFGVSLGSGGIKSNVVVLGADQFELPQQAAEQAAFFNWFYWSINIGATAAYLFLTNLALHGWPEVGIPKNFGFFASFCIPTTAFIIGVSVFRLGKAQYKMKPPEGSAVTSFVITLSGACLRGRGLFLLAACILLPVSFVLIVLTSPLDAGPLRDTIASSGLVFVAISLALLAVGGSDTRWLYTGGTRASALPAERDAADVVRILPLAACVCVFWMIYVQMSSNFQLQGCQMDLNTAVMDFSPATLSVCDSVVIMVLIPVVDRLVYPALRRCGIDLSMVTKITIGFGFAGLSVACAGVVEILRKYSSVMPGDGICPSRVPMSSLSIWAQTPQYMLIGLGEIFAAITCYELFYSEVPAHMRSVCQSINLLCTAFGSLAAAGLNSVMASWIPPNLNDGHMEYVFFFLAAVMALNIFFFVRLSAQFDYRADLFSEVDDGTFHPSGDYEQSYSEALLHGLRMSGTGHLDFLVPGMIMGGRMTTSRASSKRPTERLTGNSECLDSLLDSRGVRDVNLGIAV